MSLLARLVFVQLVIAFAFPAAVSGAFYSDTETSTGNQFVATIPETIVHATATLSATGTELTDHQQRIVVTDATFLDEMRSDGRDLRVFSAASASPWTDPTNKLPYWIESVSPSQLVFWARVPTVSASAPTVLHLYVGNFTATAESSDVATFERVFTGTPLMGYWSYDETSGALVEDLSRRGHNGTLFGGPVRETGIRGGAIATDGVDDYLNVPHAALLEPQTFTLASWARSTGTNWNKFGWIANKRANDDTSGYLIHPNAGTATLGVYAARTTGGWTSVEHTPADVTQWRHYAATFDGSTLRFYVDGILVGSAAHSGAGVHYAGGPLQFGSDATSRYTDRYGLGSLDDAVLFDRALTAAEIADVHAGKVFVPPGAPAGTAYVRDHVVTEPGVTVVIVP